MWTDFRPMKGGRRLWSALAVAWPIGLSVASPVAADTAQADPPQRLVYLQTHQVFQDADGLREPSGLAFDPKTGAFLTVSDDSRHVFRIGPDGAIVQRLPKIDGLEDAEGIDLAPDGTRLLLLSEDLGTILSLDTAAQDEATLHPLSELPGFEAFLAAAGNDPERLSPEGLAINSQTGSVLVANERDPRVLIEVAPALDSIVGVKLLSEERGFVCDHASDDDLDVSGLAYDAQRNGFWITSDTGKCVFFWDGSDSPARHFDLAWPDGDKVRPVDNAEGVALGPDGTTLFVVTDDGKSSRIVEYGIE
jgi:uncharacterized protein YjiK